MFKVCGFFHFSGTERVKQNFEDEDEDHSKPSILVSQIPFQVISIKAECLFSFSLEMKLFCSLYPAGWVTVLTYLRAGIFQKQ